MVDIDAVDPEARYVRPGILALAQTALGARERLRLVQAVEVRIKLACDGVRMEDVPEQPVLAEPAQVGREDRDRVWPEIARLVDLHGDSGPANLIKRGQENGR